MFFHEKDGLIKNKAKQLIIPYIITSVSVTLILTIEELIRCCIENVDFAFALGTLQKYSFLSIYGNGYGENIIPFYQGSYIGAIWFLLALFWGLLFLRWILRIPQKTIQFLVVTILLIVGIISSDYVWLPFSIQAGMAAVVFMWVGRMIVDSYGGIQKLIDSKMCLICFSVLWGIAIFFGYRNGTLNMVDCDFSNPLLNVGGHRRFHISDLVFP